MPLAGNPGLILGESEGKAITRDLHARTQPDWHASPQVPA